MAGLVLATALGTLTACGGEKSALPGPDVTSAPPPPTSTAVIPPTEYEQGFSAVAKAADAAPALAQRLAAEVVQAANVRGEVNSPAATLRAKLTHRLVMHVHLVGLVAVSVLDTGPDSERTAAALEAVDANSVALAKLIPKTDKAAKPSAKPTADEDEDSDKVADVARRSPDFLTAWRTHVDDLAAYALAAREGIHADKDDARRDLDTWRAAAASSLKDAAAGRARSTTLRNNLGGYTKAITRAMDGFAEKTVTGPEQLRKAASAMTDVANTLGQGLAKAGDLEGDANDNAAGIRAEFTRLVTENIAMTSATAVAAYAGKPGGVAGAPAQIAKLGLDENSKDLAERLRPAADPRERVQFLQLWRTAVNDFLDYIEAVRADSQKRADAEVKALNTQRKGLSEFVADLGNGKGASALSAALRTHIANLTGAIVALKAHLDPSA